MSRVDNILFLTYLLHEHGSISVQDVRRHCKVSERTAYRYLSTMTKANIPVFFDIETRCYRLLRSQTLSIQNLTLNDIVLLVCGLGALKISENSAYNDEICRLVDRLIAKYPTGLSELWEILNKNRSGNGSYASPISITHQVIWAGMLLKRKIFLSVAAESQPVAIYQPKLVLKDHLYVTDARNNERFFRVDEIQHVELDTK